jgi:hypothetical protein
MQLDLAESSALPHNMLSIPSSPGDVLSGSNSTHRPNGALSLKTRDSKLRRVSGLSSGECSECDSDMIRYD